MAGAPAGLPQGASGTIVKRLCGSSLYAVGMIASSIKAGDLGLRIAGGVESMTRAPFVMGQAYAGRAHVVRSGRLYPWSPLPVRHLRRSAQVARQLLNVILRSSKEAAALVVAVLWFVPMIALAADRLPGAPLTHDARIVAFGDSLTDGVGGAGESYPQRLSQLIGRTVVNAGMPGETTAEGMRRLPAVLAHDDPALLILCLGINDLLRGVSPATIRDNLVAMVRLATDAGIPTVLLAVPQPGDTRAHPLYAEVAALTGALWDGRSMVSVLSHPAQKADLVHPNRDGYRAVAEALAARLHKEALLAAD